MSTQVDSTADVPETVPARMVNEFVYCPRLFYLEWVRRCFVSSDDVAEGLYVHRAVDKQSGILPSPLLPDEFVAGGVARSVWVTSPSLKVTAKIDVVEADRGGAVTPVDYKKGRPGPDGNPWPADRVQLVLQGLVLRDVGYQVESAEIWYDEIRRRVRIALDDQAVSEAKAVVDELWAVAAREEPPPPLVDSPKCPRCSLVGICLPDEINTLSSRAHRAPRRMIPSNPDPQPLYVQEQGAVVGVRGGRIEIRRESEVVFSGRLIDVSQLCLQGNVNVTSQVMRELFAREIPVCWFSYGGWFSGIANGLPGKNVELRRRQYTLRPEVALSVARKLVEGKIRNTRTLLRRNARADVTREVASLASLADQASSAPSFSSLLGIEGAAARLYFSRFADTLSDRTDVPIRAFVENGRNRRPPPDPVNALLSFAYSLLVKDFTAILTGVGFDPYFGLYHRPRFGRPALALDLAEEFRSLVAESLVLQVINNGEVSASDFTTSVAGCQLEASGRRAVLRAYERRLSHEIKHPVFGYRVSYRRAFEVQSRLLGAFLQEELDSYSPFTTR